MLSFLFDGIAGLDVVIDVDSDSPGPYSYHADGGHADSRRFAAVLFDDVQHAAAVCQWAAAVFPDEPWQTVGSGSIYQAFPDFQLPRPMTNILVYVADGQLCHSIHAGAEPETVDERGAVWTWELTWDGWYLQTAHSDPVENARRVLTDLSMLIGGPQAPPSLARRVFSGAAA